MHNYFTITAGRTGSAWLASFLSQNLNIEEVHEPLEIDDFGIKMPDIRTMRNFNNFGNNEFVKQFWNNKFSSIQNDIYAETNHTLGKCGLVENLILHGRDKFTTLIILRRNIAKQCASYISRNDFDNITLAWQWYLHPTYIKNIVDPKHFMSFGNVSVPLWYCYEMAARQEYYTQKFSDRINIVELNLEDAIAEIGAKRFYSDLGLSGNFIIPPPKNDDKSPANKEIIDSIGYIANNLDLDIQSLVSDKIRAGFEF